MMLPCYPVTLTGKAMETGGEEKEGNKLYTWETKYEKTWYKVEIELYA